MKRTVSLAVLALGLAASSASAEGFLDFYGGSMNFLPTTTLQNGDLCAGGACAPIPGLQWAELNNVHLLSTPTGGIRVGGLVKQDFFSYGGDFNLQMYGVKAKEFYFVGAPVNADRSYPGGTVVQPGGDFIVGVPLRIVRLYGGVGLNIPMLFYDYQTYDASTNTTGTGVGASATIGYDLFFGARWLVTNNMNIFIEDRFGWIFMPIAAKDSVLGANGDVVNGTLVLNSLNSNAIVAGLGFAF